MTALDRLATIAVTATLTSAGWILFGSSFVIKAADTAPTNAVQPSPSPASPAAKSLDIEDIQLPARAPTGELIIPVEGVKAADLSDTFSDERGAGTRLHEALDIMAPRGTRVLAAAGGTVERLFKSDAGGNTVYVRSPDRRTIYYYAHLDSYAPNLVEGALVRMGDALGTVGSSGNASPDAPHLHFAIMRTTPASDWWEPSTAINPYPLLVVNEPRR
ncbi:peptidoglycan DD-metalloendopeptidase family protein [Altererythrobacter salegens]|uniref:Peptidoglycan DD-metalloendopeptidase family protein n=1 Tax=Croceibacterium salegens TaxID=1737568 RepID=A0A6I4SVA4_9SPHN|nr:M23 family metallopeptidase [Croceibacterium salegens]MXO58716.1 peptidoglycan DD-metalloendopeptidase family protein [Croceibacterium salegens]